MNQTKFFSSMILSILMMFFLLMAAVKDASASKPAKGWLGVGVEEMTPSLRDEMKLGDRSGLLITDVVPDSPADKAGLREDDVIIKFGDQQVDRGDEFARLVRNTEPDSKVKMTIVRHGEEQEVDVTIGKQRSRRMNSFAWNDDGRTFFFSDRPRMGIQVHDLNPDLAAYFKGADNGGVLILKVDKDSPAQAAGLKAGDVITKIDNQNVPDTEALMSSLEDYDKGDTVTVAFVRKGKQEKTEVELEDGGEEHEFRIMRPGPPLPPHFRHRSPGDRDEEREIIIRKETRDIDSI